MSLRSANFKQTAFSRRTILFSKGMKLETNAQKYSLTHYTAIHAHENRAGIIIILTHVKSQPIASLSNYHNAILHVLS